MAYLTLPDYTLRIGFEHITEILEQAAELSGLTPDNVRTNAESWAQATVKSYLSSQYKIGEEYLKDSASDPPRNMLIMQVTIDLALCTIHKTINPRDLPEHIAKACEDAIAWLKEVRDETVTIDLPEVDPPAGGVPYDRTFINSQVKFISKPFQDLSLFDTPSTPTP